MSAKTLKKVLGDMLVLSVQAKGMARGLEKSEQPIDEKDAHTMEEFAKLLSSNCDTVDMVVGKLRRIAPFSKNFVAK